MTHDEYSAYWHTVAFVCLCDEQARRGKVDYREYVMGYNDLCKDLIRHSDLCSSVFKVGMAGYVPILHLTCIGLCCHKEVRTACICFQKENDLTVGSVHAKWLQAACWHLVMRPERSFRKFAVKSNFLAFQANWNIFTKAIHFAWQLLHSGICFKFRTLDWFDQVSVYGRCMWKLSLLVWPFMPIFASHTVLVFSTFSQYMYFLVVVGLKGLCMWLSSLLGERGQFASNSYYFSIRCFLTPHLRGLDGEAQRMLCYAAFSTTLFKCVSMSLCSVAYPQAISPSGGQVRWECARKMFTNYNVSVDASHNFQHVLESLSSTGEWMSLLPRLFFVFCLYCTDGVCLLAQLAPTGLGWACA